MSQSDENHDNKPDNNLQQRLQDDFVVRNMPAFSRLSGTSYQEKNSRQDKGSLKLVDRQSVKPSAKTTGLIIIGVGLLVIVSLFYLAYRFLIAPALNSGNVTDSNTKTQPLSSSTPVATDDFIPQASSSDLIIVPTDNTVATSSPNQATDAVLPIVLDSDNDGLSDISEGLLGTSMQAADSDNDGYNDLAEIFNGYNPTGGGFLSDNQGLGLYVHPDRIFALVYPAAWTASQISINSTLFSAPDQSFIQVSFEDNEQADENILAWYHRQFSDTDVITADRLLVSNLGPGVLSVDQQIAYFLDANSNKIIVVSYIKSGEEASYLDIFKLIATTLMRP